MSHDSMQRHDVILSDPVCVWHVLMTCLVGCPHDVDELVLADELVWLAAVHAREKPEAAPAETSPK